MEVTLEMVRNADSSAPTESEAVRRVQESVLRNNASDSDVH